MTLKVWPETFLGLPLFRIGNEVGIIRITGYAALDASRFGPGWPHKAAQAIQRISYLLIGDNYPKLCHNYNFCHNHD